MQEPNNPYDVLEELRWIVNDLKRALYGDTTLRTPGLFNELDSLRKDVHSMKIDVESIKNRRPRLYQWLAGYAAFCVGLILAVIALLDQGQVIHTRVPAELAGLLAVVLITVAAVLLMSGHGWTKGDK